MTAEQKRDHSLAIFRARYEHKDSLLEGALGLLHSHSQAISAAIRRADKTDYSVTPAEEEEMRGRIRQVLETLTRREREIIMLRHGIGDGYTYTLKEVGRIFKVTIERVRQVEAKAIRKLQHPTRKAQLENLL